ncbi:hypothetical protein RFI_09085 [Reticulomyxa filosa]|uniref:Uncharacterized protein n=1 Tax=Reticulomyxa filosa TaxID=46433 RepID=X6NP47_RETFI|nr:hypothetical protein RFI_09085 [Reticulomyxa filosa]|eukprot:ETO28050.1 hypothetical protein RFI_09085 [Reticulomyxa filosa]
MCLQNNSWTMEDFLEKIRVQTIVDHGRHVENSLQQHGYRPDFRSVVELEEERQEVQLYIHICTCTHIIAHDTKKAQVEEKLGYEKNEKDAVVKSNDSISWLDLKLKQWNTFVPLFSQDKQCVMDRFDVYLEFTWEQCQTVMMQCLGRLLKCFYIYDSSTNEASTANKCMNVVISFTFIGTGHPAIVLRYNPFKKKKKKRIRTCVYVGRIVTLKKYMCILSRLRKNKNRFKLIINPYLFREDRELIRLFVEKLKFFSLFVGLVEYLQISTIRELTIPCWKRFGNWVGRSGDWHSAEHQPSNPWASISFFVLSEKWLQHLIETFQWGTIRFHIVDRLVPVNTLILLSSKYEKTLPTIQTFTMPICYSTTSHLQSQAQWLAKILMKHTRLDSIIISLVTKDRSCNQN